MKLMGLNIKRFTHIWFINLKAKMMARLEFRTNFLLMIVGSFAQFVSFVAGIRFLYQYTDLINGWTFNEALSVAASFFLVDGILWALCGHHISMSRLTREGMLDYMMVRPIDVQFSVSTYRGDPEDWVRVVTSVFALSIALKGMFFANPLISALLYFFTIISSIVIFYSISLAINSMALFMTETWGVFNFFESFVRLGQYPTDIYYHKIIQVIVHSLIPIAFIGTVPAKMLRGDPSYALLLGGAFAAIISLVVSRKIWLYAVKNYSNVSS